MKSHKSHRVPLSPRALAIVTERIKTGGKFVFQVEMLTSR